MAQIIWTEPALLDFKFPLIGDVKFPIKDFGNDEFLSFYTPLKGEAKTMFFERGFLLNK